MFRNFDWRCRRCGRTQEHILEVPQGTPPDEWPRSLDLDCCYGRRPHDRMMPKTAHFMKKPMAPMVAGGEFDTMGNKPLTPTPEHGEFERLDDFREYVNTKEYKEAREKQEEEKKQNAAKKERAKLIRSGVEIDMREHRLPGDPDLES